VNNGLRVTIELVQEEDIRMHGFKVVAVHLIRREVLEIERDDDWHSECTAAASTCRSLGSHAWVMDSISTRYALTFSAVHDVALRGPDK